MAECVSTAQLGTREAKARMQRQGTLGSASLIRMHNAGVRSRAGINAIEGNFTLEPVYLGLPADTLYATARDRGM